MKTFKTTIITLTAALASTIVWADGSTSQTGEQGRSNVNYSGNTGPAVNNTVDASNAKYQGNAAPYHDQGQIYIDNGTRAYGGTSYNR